MRAQGAPAAEATPQLRLNPIACAARGLCAELLPEHISLDEWGFPVLDRAPIRAGLLPQARQAVTACPTLALRLERSSGRQQR